MLVDPLGEHWGARGGGSDSTLTCTQTLCVYRNSFKVGAERLKKFLFLNMSCYNVNTEIQTMFEQQKPIMVLTLLPADPPHSSRNYFVCCTTIHPPTSAQPPAPPFSFCGTGKQCVWASAATDGGAVGTRGDLRTHVGQRSQDTGAAATFWNLPPKYAEP